MNGHKPDSQHDTLFLHWGPGGSSHVERQLLGTKWPNVYFWDQPHIRQAGNAFGILLDAATTEVERLAQANRRPVKLIAHSFGGHLASGLIERIPDRIGDCHLFSTGYDIPVGFWNLLGVMAKCPTTENSLREKIGQLLASSGGQPLHRNKIWDYIQLAFSDPRVVRHYLPTLDQYEAYSALAATGPALDFGTYQNVLNDFLANHFGREVRFSGSQTILIEFGGKDPALALEAERRHWTTRFPSARISIRPEAGHFIHLEPYLGKAGGGADCFSPV